MAMNMRGFLSDWRCMKVTLGDILTMSLFAAAMIAAMLMLLSLGGCAAIREDNAARAAYMRAECAQAGYVDGSPEFRGCVSMKESQPTAMPTVRGR